MLFSYHDDAPDVFAMSDPLPLGVPLSEEDDPEEFLCPAERPLWFAEDSRWQH